MSRAAAEGPLVHLREHQDVIARDVATIRARHPLGSRVLDVGAGRGSFVREIARQGYDALGLDMQMEATAVWRLDKTRGVVGSGAAAPFVGASFDVVRMKEVLEHVEDPLAMVREARRLLRPGGTFISHTPTPQSQLFPVGNFWDDYTHVRPFSRTGLTRLTADAGLRLERIDGYVSGRNGIERAFGRVLALVFPHIYLVIATRPESD